MKEVVTRLGPWRLERALGRDVHGTYHAGILDDGARATLYRPSSELAAARGNPLQQLVELHRALDHRGVVGFRGIGHDGDEPFLIADPVDDGLASLLRGRRPAAIDTRTVGVALAAALLAVHDHGLVHGGLDLDTAVWAPDRAARILGPGVATLGITGDLAQARGDVVGLGRLLCALIASWPRRGGGWNADELRTIELVRVIADPGAGVSMRDAHALLADGARMPAPRATGSAAEPTPVAMAATASTGRTHDYVPGPDVDLARGDPADPVHGPLGRYRVVARIGAGGMGEVFLAEDPTLRRGVAIKRIRPALQRDRTFRARLRREAQLAAQLGHRAIVQVFDLVTEDNVDHLVMEYVAGPSLHALLAGQAMPVAEAVRIAGEIADALVYAHGRGIVHRDLKLENVLIGSDGQPKIVDFGIARRTPLTGDTPHESLTRDGVMVGTSRAMSPEQIQCRDVDARSDLFSFGVLLYELLTGTSPFAAGNAALTMVRVLSDRQAPARTLVPAIPPALAELVDQLLEKDPALRPDSARTVRDRLTRVLDGAAREPEPSLPPERAGVARRFTGIAAAGTREHALPFLPRDVTQIGGDHHAPRKALASRIQAPFVLAEIRALRSSIFKRSPEIQSALAIADKVEHAYDLHRADLFIPAGDTWCAILEPFAMSVLTGTLRRIGYEIFPQYVQILGIAAPDVRTAMELRGPADLVRVICDAYSKCVIGSDAGTLSPRIEPGKAIVTDTTFIPCQLQMGVFLGAGQLTGLFRDSALTERQCRGRGDPVCVYEFAF